MALLDAGLRYERQTSLPWSEGRAAFCRSARCWLTMHRHSLALARRSSQRQAEDKQIVLMVRRSHAVAALPRSFPERPPNCPF